MCGCISYGLVGLIRSLKVLYDLTRSLTVLYDRLYDYTRTWHPCQFFFSFKNHTRLSRMATVGSVYTDGQPYKPCVLCQTGLRQLAPLDTPT